MRTRLRPPSPCPRCKGTLFADMDGYVCSSCGWHDWSVAKPSISPFDRREYMTLAEASSMYRVSKLQLRRYVDRGWIAGARKAAVSGGDAWWLPRDAVAGLFRRAEQSGAYEQGIGA